MANPKHTLLLVLLVLPAALVLAAQSIRISQQGQGQQDQQEVRLPNGKSQKDAILKDDYRKNLEDARDLLKLSEDLKLEIEKNDQFVVSLGAIKMTEDIEKLAKRIRSRLKRP